MKGFNTSTDYKLLWELINQGYRIPAWILYSDEYEEPIYDLVEVKIYRGKDYMIGTRGHGYGGLENNQESFIKVCQSLELKFVKPNELEQG